MFEPNVARLLAELRPTDVVLDVGGWACPFNRAQWILDAEPYETRGYYRTFGGKPHQGGDIEWFNKDRWVVRDICGREPWPFADKQFDFAICSHVLEDIRDPLWVASELMRVARRGYIEVPSREWETCLGVEHPRIAGLSHHRWLIDIAGSGIKFTMKYHLIHSEPDFSLPRVHLRRMPLARTIQYLWWEDRFDVEEVTIHGLGNIRTALASYVQSVRPTPRWAARLAAAKQSLRKWPAAVRRTLLGRRTR